MINAELGCEPAKCKGKKGKKAKCPGGAAKGMPRAAIKSLIQQELEKAVPGIFDKLITDNVVEESKDP